MSRLLLLPVLLLVACGSKDDTGEPALFSAFSAAPHAEVATLLQVAWTQEVGGPTWVEYAWGDQVGSTPPVTREPGDAGATLLGIPGDTEVTWTVAVEVDGVPTRSQAQVAATGSVPYTLPEPALVTWDPALASPEPWVLGSVDASRDSWYSGPYWVFIADREGRIVWYREIPDYRATMWPRVSRDGTALVFEENAMLSTDPTRTSTLTWMTLDGTVGRQETLPDLGYTWDELDDGTLLYDHITDFVDVGLNHLASDGTLTEIWSCTDWLTAGPPTDCYTNTVRWSQERDTVLWSMYDANTVVELDRATGQVLWTLGDLGTWAVDPPSSAPVLQHYPGWTPEGTLLLSTHCQDEPGQRIREFAQDEAGQVFREVWTWGDGDLPYYSTYSGEAQRLANGNTLINYGTDGAIQEVTPDGQVAWEVAWPGSYLLGHNTLVGDLYALGG